MCFFEDGGRLFPKEMTLDFEFVYDSGDLIKTYMEDSESEGYVLQESMKISGLEHRFPYKRKTVKLGG